MNKLQKKNNQTMNIILYYYVMLNDKSSIYFVMSFLVKPKTHLRRSMKNRLQLINFKTIFFHAIYIHILFITYLCSSNK